MKHEDERLFNDIKKLINKRHKQKTDKQPEVIYKIKDTPLSALPSLSSYRIKETIFLENEKRVFCHGENTFFHEDDIFIDKDYAYQVMREKVDKYIEHARECLELAYREKQQYKLED